MTEDESTIEADVEDPAEADPVEDAVGERSGRGRGAWWLAACVVLAVVAVVSLVVAADSASARRREQADRREVADVSGRLATALSTYDYRSFDTTKQRVLALATGSFAGEYDKAVGGLASLITETKATSEATVSDVFIGEVEGGKATSIVVVEIRGNGVSGSRVSVDNYVQLSLVKVEGRWKVDGVSNLNLGVVSAAGTGTSTPAASSTTSTSVG